MQCNYKWLSLLKHRPPSHPLIDDTTTEESLLLRPSPSTVEIKSNCKVPGSSVKDILTTTYFVPQLLKLSIVVALLILLIGVQQTNAGHQKKKKIVIHVPVHKKIEKHIHTVIKHVHHHHTNNPIVLKEEKKIIHEEVRPIQIHQTKEHIHHHEKHEHQHQHHHPIHEVEVEPEEEHIHHHHNYEHKDRDDYIGAGGGGGSDGISSEER
ncbi:histidine-rich glycoprotein [Drosophila willistoni]|uniref:histidine-rich glycoprotein n=1 Tax=Drosophila willistoni TaxID=7260 RepID=UPI001F07CC53|nr:histidine-rich glycoprotein [Drosophila willistoni]